MKDGIKKVAIIGPLFPDDDERAMALVLGNIEIIHENGVITNTLEPRSVGYNVKFSVIERLKALKGKLLASEYFYDLFSDENLNKRGDEHPVPDMVFVIASTPERFREVMNDHPLYQLWVVESNSSWIDPNQADHPTEIQSILTEFKCDRVLIMYSALQLMCD